MPRIRFGCQRFEVGIWVIAGNNYLVGADCHGLFSNASDLKHSLSGSNLKFNGTNLRIFLK
jgi:hypothetical protein